MQLLNIRDRNRRLGSRLRVESQCHVLDRRPFPAADHDGMDTVLLGQFSHRQFLADGLKGHLGFELRRMEFPSRRLRSVLFRR